MTLPRPGNCESCAGEGRLDYLDTMAVRPWMLDPPEYEADCDSCEGTGWSACDHCDRHVPTQRVDGVDLCTACERAEREAA